MSKPSRDPNPQRTVYVAPANLEAAVRATAVEHAIAIRKNADGTYTASTLVIEGDRVVSRDESKANFRAYAEQQFRIRAGKMFHEIETGRKA